MKIGHFTAAEIATLEAAYRNTTYEVYLPQETIALQIGIPNPEVDRLLIEHDHTTWAFITAYNPYSQTLSTAANQNRDRQLQVVVSKYTTYDALGKDNTRVWTPEPSFLIVGIERERAIAIGRQFEQNAIVWGEIDSPPELLWL